MSPNSAGRTPLSPRQKLAASSLPAIARVLRNNPLLVCGIFVICLPFLVNGLWILPRANADGIPGYSYATQARLKSWDDRRLVRRSGETTLDFAGRLTMVVHQATYHCDSKEIGQSWWAALAHRLGFFDEQGLSSQGLLSLAAFRCGFCHARAYILAVALRKGGIVDAASLGLHGHVVTTFTLNGERYVTDPDFGIYPFVLPDDADAPRGLFGAVERNYSSIVRTHNVVKLAVISDIYAARENRSIHDLEYQNNVRAGQDKILAWQRPIEIWCVVAGLAIIALHFLARRSFLRENFAEKFSGIRRRETGADRPNPLR